jgi:hypothetical protein
MSRGQVDQGSILRAMGLLTLTHLDKLRTSTQRPDQAATACACGRRATTAPAAGAHRIGRGRRPRSSRNGREYLIMA